MAITSSHVKTNKSNRIAFVEFQMRRYPNILLQKFCGNAQKENEKT